MKVALKVATLAGLMDARTDQMKVAMMAAWLVVTWAGKKVE
jgi:hypothetical protein